MNALIPMANGGGHFGLPPSLRRAPFCSSQLSHLRPAPQHRALVRSDLTSNLQLRHCSDLAVTMAARQDQVDMETFQRLSENYQPNVQVESCGRLPVSLKDLTLSRDL